MLSLFWLCVCHVEHSLFLQVDAWIMDDIWFIADDRWWMADDGWRMTDDRWRMTDDRWRMTDDRWRMTDDRWQMTDDRWRMTDDGWQMTDDGWRMTDYRWRMIMCSLYLRIREIMRYMIYWDDLILWWPLSYFGLSMSVSILRCLSEPSFMFVTHCQERNLCYFTQKSLLGGGGGGGGGIAIIESAPGPDLEIWDGDGYEMNWTWPGHDLDMTWTWSGPELDNKLKICSYLYFLSMSCCKF